ncbi:MAG: glycosyltransferase family 2 protein, partial [Hyphomonas sp.]
MSDRLISVVLPAYNAGPYIDAAIGSILSQTYPHFELIVIDDGSTDDTLARIEAFAARDSRIRVVSRENRGLIATLNEGIGLAKGDLIARMDADDIAYPERFRRQVAAFEADPGLCLCGTAVDILYKERIYAGDVPSALISRSAQVMSLFYTILLHPTLMIDRRLAGDDLFYDPSYPHAEDFD